MQSKRRDIKQQREREGISGETINYYKTITLTRASEFALLNYETARKHIFIMKTHFYNEKIHSYKTLIGKTKLRRAT